MAQKKSQTDTLTSNLNTQHPSIKFTMKREGNGTLPMLDAKIHKNSDGTVKCTVYRKKTHTDQYLDFNSHHPLQHKLGVIRTLVHRAETVITKDEDKKAEVDHIKKVLKVCGYNDWTFNVATKKKDKTVSRNTTHSTGPRPSVTLPYISGTSDALRRILIKHNIQVHMKPFNTIRQFLVNPKDPVPKDKVCGAIYYVPCNDCPASYIGETERPFKKRLQEHQRPSNKSSPVVQHNKSTGHKVNDKNVRILEKEDNWFRRGVKEAIYIKANNSTLNRDQGRHHLPAVYERTIRSHVTPVACDH